MNNNHYIKYTTSAMVIVPLIFILAFENPIYSNPHLPEYEPYQQMTLNGQLTVPITGSFIKFD
jgi:hypothetical protein